jgi:hypothetical protein
MKKRLLLSVLIITVMSVGIPLLGSDCGTGIKKINASNTDELASFIFFDKKTDTEILYFLSVNEAGSGMNSNKHSDIYYSTRRIIKTTDSYNNTWNYPSFMKWCKNDDGLMHNLNLGPIAIWGNDMIISMESQANNGGYQNSYNGNPNFDLYVIQYNSGNLSCRTPLSTVNMEGYWDSHPAFSADGSTLYFASDRPGGKGGTDIYYTKRNNDGSWGYPVNLANINTPGNEVSPHCGLDGFFYFSSDWDIEKNQLSKFGKNIHITNYNAIGEPHNPKNIDKYIKENTLCPSSCEKYNSEFDDVFPFVSADKSYLYISSNDKNGKFDIKVFSLYKPGITLKCKFKDVIQDSEGNILAQNFINNSAIYKITDGYGKTSVYNSSETVFLEADSRYKIEPDYYLEKCKNGEILGNKVFIVNTSKPSGCDTVIEKEFSFKGSFTSARFEIPSNSFISGYWKPLTVENMNEFRARASQGFFKDFPVIDKNYDDNEQTYKNEDEFSKLYVSIDKFIRDNFDCLNFDGVKMKITLNSFAFTSGLQNLTYPDENVNIKNFEITNGTRINDTQKGNLTLSRLRAYFTYKILHNMMSVRSSLYKSLYAKGKIEYDLEGYGVSQVALNTDGKSTMDVNKIQLFIDFAPIAWIDNSAREENGRLSFKNEPIAQTGDKTINTNPQKSDDIIITSETEIPQINKELLKDKKNDTKTVTGNTDKTKKVTKKTETKIDTKKKAEVEKKVVAKVNKKPEISVKPKEKKVVLKQKETKPIIKDTVKKVVVKEKKITPVKEKSVDTGKDIAKVDKKTTDIPVVKPEIKKKKTPIEKKKVVVTEKPKVTKKVPIEKKKVIIADKKAVKEKVVKKDIVKPAEYKTNSSLKDFESLITEYSKTDKYSVNCGAYIRESNCANLVGFLQRNGIDGLRIVPITKYNRTYYRVRIGLFDSSSEAQAKALEIRSIIRKARIGAPVVVVQD